ncbi:MAG: hypothetical protein HOP13_06625, partial [Alphaproteobacteria bacterium]|nr:hypothetical protein [Alphaproteobacteria bacterium]
MRMIVLAVPVLFALAACEQQKQPQQQQQPQPQPQKVQTGSAPFAYANVQTMPKAADGAAGSGGLA